VTATLGAAWRPGDPAFAAMDDKRAALERITEHFIVPAAG
jgi:hypothetical protein